MFKLDISKDKSMLFLMGICLVASTGGFLFGFDTAVIAGTFEFVESHFALSKLALGWFGSSAIVGCILGAIVAGWLSDRFGRKPILILGAIFFFISAFFSATCPTFNILITARILGGIGVGLTSVIAPMFISEFAPAKSRGRLVALYQLSIVVGVLLAYLSNWALLNYSSSNPEAFSGIMHKLFIAEIWRGMFAMEMIPNVIFIIFMLLVPESPRWLINKGRVELAQKIMTRVSGKEEAEKEVKRISESVSHEKGSLKELLQPGLRIALIVGIGLSVFGQMTGVNIVVYYGPTIIKEAGLGTASAFQYQVILGLINLIFTVIAIFKIDSWGRRPLLIWGMACVTLSLTATGILFSIPTAPKMLILIVLGIYIACVAFSICSVIWVITSEIFPNRIRGRAMSIAIFANWGTNTISAFMFPWYVQKFGMNTGFFTFAAICLVATIFFWKLVPETKGKSLEDIEDHWHSAKKC
ncbi:MAG: sugar porter family MFS transporter [Lentisphaeria bacterium]|nr:sugar porter family MFS transporter [Lentisphaeria bacterium]